MKTQTKIATLVTALIICFGTMVSAQEVSFGITAGVNFQNINGKDVGGDKLENNLMHGFNGGINVDIPIAPEFYIQPGLLFTTKGAKVSEHNGDIIEGSSRLHLYYVEIPVNLLFKPALGNGHMLLGFGPYLAYGIGGKLSIEGKIGNLEYNDDMDVEYTSEVDYSSDPLDQIYVKPFDVGANFIIGYETAMGFSAQLNAQLGLLELTPDYKGFDNKDATQKNTGFGISLGYRF